MYFRLGGGTLKGISKPGEVVWSRVFVDGGILKADLGRARAIELPKEETERRWRTTTPQWPIMHAVTPGITRDQMMARHMSNHIQVAYAPDAEGFFWLAGQGGFGLQTSPAMAAIVDSLITGARWPAPDVSPESLSPARFAEPSFADQM